MAEPKQLKTRIIHKHATAAVWDTKTTFIPLQGELIVYDADSTFSYERFKIGDGKTTIVALPFAPAAEALKLKTARRISLNGDVTGSILFDGSSDATMATQLQGSFTGSFKGSAKKHSHNFTGKSGTGTATYTPTGTVSASYTPEGSISTPDITVNQTKKTITVVTSAGSPGVYTPGSCSFPEIKEEFSGDTLTLSLTDGSYTPGSLTEGTSATTASITYVENATATSSKPTFTGSEATIDSDFVGTTTTITTNFTPEGTVEETEITPEGTVTVNYNN